MATLPRWPWERVLVVGPSMAPTLRHGDHLLVRRGATVRPGDVVLARFPEGPDHLVVKRAVRPDVGGWWVEGDNSLLADDSRRFGAAVVVAKAVGRTWPWRSIGRIPAIRRAGGVEIDVDPRPLGTS